MKAALPSETSLSTYRQKAETFIQLAANFTDVVTLVKYLINLDKISN